MHAKDNILWSVQPSIICIFFHMPSSLGKLYDLRIIIYYSTHPLNYSPTHIFIDLFSGLQVQCNKISIAFLFIAIPFPVACSWIHTWKDARNRLSRQNKNYSLASFVIVWGLVAKTGRNLVFHGFPIAKDTITMLLSTTHNQPSEPDLKTKKKELWFAPSSSSIFSKFQFELSKEKSSGSNGMFKNVNKKAPMVIGYFKPCSHSWRWIWFQAK